MWYYNQSRIILKYSTHLKSSTHGLGATTTALWGHSYAITVVRMRDAMHIWNNWESPGQIIHHILLIWMEWKRRPTGPWCINHLHWCFIKNNFHFLVTSGFPFRKHTEQGFRTKGTWKVFLRSSYGLLTSKNPFFDQIGAWGKHFVSTYTQREEKQS